MQLTYGQVGVLLLASGMKSLLSRSDSTPRNGRLIPTPQTTPQPQLSVVQFRLLSAPFRSCPGYKLRSLLVRRLVNLSVDI